MLSLFSHHVYTQARKIGVTSCEIPWYPMLTASSPKHHLYFQLFTDARGRTDCGQLIGLNTFERLGWGCWAGIPSQFFAKDIMTFWHKNITIRNEYNSYNTILSCVWETLLYDLYDFACSISNWLFVGNIWILIAPKRSLQSDSRCCSQCGGSMQEPNQNWDLQTTAISTNSTLW